MSILFKGNLEEGNYTLIKSTDGWVLKGETSYVGFNIVRCKECYMCDEEMWCSFYDSIMESDDFCSYGERRSE